jgi:adenosylcobinamide-GDP ribazoletransferase
MRDSRIGTYGVVALALSLAARWQALALILAGGGHWAALIAVAALSRAAMPMVMRALPHARGDGLSRSVGRPRAARAWAAAGVAALVALPCLGLGGTLGAVVLVALVATGVALLAKAKIGGQTGDVLGATQQLCEIALLCALAA